MTYKVTLLDFAVEDFDQLDASIQFRANKQFEKLRKAAELGDDLGNKFDIDLTGYKALHFYKNQYRIVYRILPIEAGATILTCLLFNAML